MHSRGVRGSFRRFPEAFQEDSEGFSVSQGRNRRSKRFTEEYASEGSFRGFSAGVGGVTVMVFQGVKGRPSGFNKVFESISERFKEFSEALKGRFRRFRSISGALQEVQRGFKGFTD